MNPQIEKLFKLTEIALEDDMFSLELVDQWNFLREQHGLAKLILLIRDESRLKTETPETSKSN